MKRYLGIDLGGTNMVAGVVDEKFNLLNTCRTSTDSKRSFEEIVADMAMVAKKALSESGLSEQDIDYVGIGAPSMVNPKTNRLIFANNLGWRNVDIGAEFQKSWDIPVKLGNDADCAALGEVLAGVAKEHSSALMITLGTGVGGGIVIDNKLFLGGEGMGVEPGHFTLIYNGAYCSCGRRGCLEAYASVTALIRQTIDRMVVSPHSLMWEECGKDLNKVSGRTSFDAARRGDEAAIEVVTEYIDYLGVGIASLVTAIRPEAVIIGGGISNEGDSLIIPLKKVVYDNLYAKDIIAPPPILKAKLGNSAGIIGAALLGIQGEA